MRKSTLKIKVRYLLEKYLMPFFLVLMISILFLMDLDPLMECVIALLALVCLFFILGGIGYGIIPDWLEKYILMPFFLVLMLSIFFLMIYILYLIDLDPLIAGIIAIFAVVYICFMLITPKRIVERIVEKVPGEWTLIIGLLPMFIGAVMFGYIGIKYLKLIG